MKPLLTARLACGCRLAFQGGRPDGQATVVLDRKSETCTIAIHVGGMPLYDHHPAMRPATRVSPPTQPDYEDS
jgi:hypothetical protein